MAESDGSFLSRWARRKAAARQEVAAPEPAAPLATPAPASGSVSASSSANANANATPTTLAVASEVEAKPAAQADTAERREAPPAPTLAEAQALTPQSDFSRFVAPSVDPQVKNAAMKQLFTDPHFNVMDGLDVYIDDYNTAEPLPRAIARQLMQARSLGLLDDELQEQPQPETAHEDPAVQLQPDPAAERPGPGADAEPA